MITKIHIENFKGIGSPGIDIELKPITLLFGANSAGKSTVLHALLYLREILDKKNLDVYKTDLGGQTVNLGGFKQMVHNTYINQIYKIIFQCTWFSLLNLCAEACATYDGLYHSNKIRPKILSIFNPGCMGGEWTSLYENNGFFHRILKANPAGLPEYLFSSDYLFNWKDEYKLFNSPSLLKQQTEYTSKLFLYELK